MITIKLPDGVIKEYSDEITLADIAMEISPELAKHALVAEVDGELVDLSTKINDGTHTVRILTEDDERSLEILRHTTAHVLAQAVRRLFGDEVQYTIGPALVEDSQYGFYYDFDLPAPISADDLPRIEQEMRKIIKEKIPIERLELPAEQAKERFTRLGQKYKVEMIDDLVKNEGVSSISLYKQGDFIDMCRGPHLPDTGKVKAFKLLTTAGAYWRGDENNPMLTRIYGTAFFDEKQLTEHIERIEEAKKRDHRVLGKQLGLFLISNAVGQGLPLWLPKGTIIRIELQNWLRDELFKQGYQFVFTPHIGKVDLYRTSGYYPYYEHGLFPAMEVEQGQAYLLKPMNCPHHIQIYLSAPRTYRNLPLRLAEFGTVYRLEQSGELSGLIRVRGFTQDDAHIFCTPEQLLEEVESCANLAKMVLETVGLNDYRVRIGLRDPDSSKYTGSKENWDLAEDNIRQVVRKLQLDYTEEPGEAAFYGPKIDFITKDCIGREWQLGTIQVDYNLPERFNLEYIGPDNVPHRPVMIHRAPLGSLDRFIGILIEHFAGAFPLWLAPVQVAVLPVSEKSADYAQKVLKQLQDVRLRAEVDASPDKIGAKIRRWTMEKVPYMFIIGQREVENETVSVRKRKAGQVGTFRLTEVIELLKIERDTRGSQEAFT